MLASQLGDSSKKQVDHTKDRHLVLLLGKEEALVLGQVFQFPEKEKHQGNQWQ